MTAFVVSVALLSSARAATLWAEAGASVAQNSGPGRDVLKGALKRDDASRDTLYFKFRVTPLSDATTEEYFAAFELFEGDTERLGVGNAAQAYAYSVFFRADPREGGGGANYLDLRSANPERDPSGPASDYEVPRRGVPRSFVFKVQYVPGGEDLVTVWLNPDLSVGATEVQQPESLTTRFNADASFDEIRLRHGGRGDGWQFSDMAVATSFEDFVDPSSALARADGASEFLDRRRYEAETWLREPGMPRGNIKAVTQTRDGYLWLAGDEQIARFDGTRFVPFELREIVGAGSVEALLGDADGALWIGTRESGLVRHVAGRFEIFTTLRGLPANRITALAETQDGTLWIGTSAGLAKRRGTDVEPVALPPELAGAEVRALCATPAGGVWVALADRGVFHLDAGKWSPVGDAAVADLLRDPYSLAVDAKGRLWAGVAENFVLCRDDREWRRYRVSRRAGVAPIRALAAGPDGTVWVGSVGEGLSQLRDNKLMAMTELGESSAGQPSSLFVDRQGHLWVGGGAGLQLWKPRHCFNLGQAEGLGHGRVNGLAEVAPGVLWVAQRERGLYRWEGASFRLLPAAGLPSYDSLLGPMLATRDGCWLACADGLLLFRDPQAVADESQLFPLPQGHITALAEGAEGSILAGTSAGELWRLARGKWERLALAGQPAAIAALVPDGGKNLWVVVDGSGLWRFDGQKLTQTNLLAGKGGAHIRALHRDEAGTLWLATEAGLARLGNDGNTVFARDDGLPDGPIAGITEDKAGHLWLRDEAGITCVRKPSPAGGRLEVLAAFPTRSGALRQPENTNGLASIIPPSQRTQSGQLWFGTVDGLLMVEPPKFATNAAPPVLILEAIRADGRPAGNFSPVFCATAAATPGARNVLRLPPGRHSLDLEFTSPQPGGSEKLRFRYRLVGLDADWIEAGNSRTAQYHFVPPGEYQFQLQAERADGRRSEIALSLSAPPHFWQRGWVVGSALLVLLAVIGLGARFIENRRMKGRLRRLEQENALERERTRIAQDLHDEMGAKLCRISFLSEHASRLDPASSELKRQITTIAGDSRELLHSLDEIVWVVNPKNDTLEHAASYIGQYAIDYFQGTGIECAADIGRGIPHVPLSSQTRHHLFLAVHEALTNALKHSGATRVQLRIAWTAPELRIEVSDNGRGFEVGAGRSNETDGQSHDGLGNMRQRMAAIGGECRTEAAPGRGTRIEFVLRMKSTQPEGAAS